MEARGRGPEVHIDEPLAKFQRFLPKRFFFFLHALRQFFQNLAIFGTTTAACCGRVCREGGGQAPPAIDPQNISMAPTPVAGAFAGEGGVRGRGLPLPPAIDAPKHKHGSHVFPPSAAKHARRCSAPPRTTSGLAQPWLSVCPRGRSCLKMFQSENMYARRCGCDSIVNARRDTNGTTATACLNAETHVGPGANRGEAAGV